MNDDERHYSTIESRMRHSAWGVSIGAVLIILACVLQLAGDPFASQWCEADSPNSICMERK